MIIAHRRLLLQGRHLTTNKSFIPLINTKIINFHIHSRHQNSFQQTPRFPNRPIQHFSNPSRNDPSRWYLIIGMAALLTIGSGFYFDTFNEKGTGILKDYKYDPKVSKYLKEAVWMESNKGNYNYSEALKYYAMALDEMPSHVSKLSDNYTRIELKVAEMLERLNMFDRSKDIYNEILNRFYLVLSDRSDMSTKMSVNERAELIRKDLRILIKSLELNQDIQFGKRKLLAHLLLVQEEILLKSPELKEFFDRKRERTNKLLRGQSLTVDDFQTFINEDNIKLDKDDSGLMILDMDKNSSAWEPFKEELFVARDLYTAYCLSSKDIASALTCKMTTLEWMVMADMPPGQILLAQANLGSLFYLQVEKLNADIEQINLKIQENPDLLKDETIIKALRILNKNKRNCLKMTERCYDSILDFFNKNKRLRYHIKDQLDTSIPQAIALSTYGKGVLVLHDGSLAQAEGLLKDAITLAKEEDFKELINEANKELERVQTLRLEQQSANEPQKTVS